MSVDLREVYNLKKGKRREKMQKEFYGAFTIGISEILLQRLQYPDVDIDIL